MSTATLIFDGDCSFCIACAKWARRHMRNAVARSWQDVDLAKYGLTQHNVETAAWWIDSAGKKYRGARAIGETLIACDGWWRILGWFCLVPPFSWMSTSVYWVIARNRHRFPGTTRDS